jgi:amino acid transporter
MVVALLAATAISIVEFRPELERNLKGWLIVVIVGLALVLVLIWFAFLSRFPWRVRLITIAALAARGLWDFKGGARHRNDQLDQLSPVGVEMDATAHPAARVRAG